MTLSDLIKTFNTRFPRCSGALRKVVRNRKKIIAAVLFIAHVAGALSTVKAIMNTRTSQGAVAWAISLNTIPIVAVPAYWIFGDSDFNGYVSARRTSRAKLQPKWDEFEAALRSRGLIYDPERTQPFVTEELAKLPATVGNDAELLIDGDAAFPSIFEGIDRAKDYVLVQFYIIHDDEVGRALKDRLVAKAKENVRCHLLYDEIGTSLPASFIRELEDAGVQVRPFNTTKGSANRFQINFRNHRKVVIVDGKEAWVGGLNVGEEYMGMDPKFGFWRDTHMRVAGPVVQSVQVGYAEDWNWATDEFLDHLNWDPHAAPSGANKAMLCLPSGPVDPLETCTLFFLHMINNAEERLWIASPYFVPDEQFISALQLAALRGVDVRIIIPDKGDNPLVNLSAWNYVEDLHNVGIEIYRYTKGFMHHKVVLVDRDYSTIGTANFDNRSFRLNFEITMGVADRDFTRQVADMLEEDMENSRLVEEEEFENKSSWFKFWVKAAHLSAPIQ